MKILHLMLACFYIDNYSYQENYLPKYHKEMGNDVEIIASLVSFDKNGNSCYLKEGSKYINEYNIPVTRLNYAKRIFSRKLRMYIGLKDELDRFAPDVIFIHGIQFLDIRIIKKYAMKNSVTIYIDNHSDFSNSCTNWFSKNVLHKIIWKKCSKCIDPFVKKYYGVLPARVDFLNRMYAIPKEKIELLVMGADDDEVAKAIKSETKIRFRNYYGISQDDYLIITGGKIDLYKRQTLLLMDAINEIENQNIKLIIFGSVVEELQDEFYKRCDNNRVKYIGWVDSKYTYECISSSDLAVFPGRHSVLWEETVALGVPIVAKFWDGTTHIDINGNVQFLKEDNVEEIRNVITNCYNNKNKLKKLADNASKEFLYSSIAKRSLK